MKSILVLLSSLVLAVLVFLSGVAFTAYVIAEPETHKFAHVDTPDLWTTEPKRVDVASQNYERLPAATPVIAEVKRPEEPVVDQTVTASVDPDNNAVETNAAQEQNPGIDFEHTQFCQARYRSYRVEDNTYQPYNGGARQQCQSPTTRSVIATAAAKGYTQAAYEGDAQPIETSAPGGSHEEWCMARYRSYSVADDSYQPFDGGPRRACQSPFG